MNDEGELYDSGLDDSGPFSVTPEPGGVSLESALREFGPAAIEDLIPRLRRLAGDLDAAHAAGLVHGRLHPSKVFITDTATWMMGAGVKPSAVRRPWPNQPPYTAPEIAAGGAPGPASDQFSLAAIAYVWMFGRPVTGPAARAIEVRAMPNVDRAALSSAFTRALALEPARRYASCTDFCGALAAAVVPALPLIVGDDDADPVEPFIPEEPPPVPELSKAIVEPPGDADLGALDFRPVDGPGAAPSMIDPEEIAPAEGVPSWQGSAMQAPERTSPRFGAVALIFATLVGAVFGFAAGYMARPRALQTAPIASGLSPASQNQSSMAAREAPAPAAPAAAPGAPAAPAGSASARKESSELRRDPAKVGSLLVRSTPSGASVQVDGVPRGETPLALRELELGTREIIVSRRGYLPEQRRVALTTSRPSRSLEVRLSAQAAAAPKRSAPPAPARPGATAGTLVVESRPIGAAVSVNGKPSGQTPLTINDLPPGEYRITLSLAGYRDFATTVRVVAGERVRAAASLTAQEQE